MQILKKRFLVAMICILFILSMTSVVFLPNANAHTPPLSVPEIAYINAAPNPVGVGQQVTVAFWLQQPPPTAGGAYGDRWQNMTVKETKPNGSITTLGPFTSDDTGGTYTYVIPDTAGNYTFQMSFPGQTLTGGLVPPGGYAPSVATFIGDYFQPATSPVITLTVQEQAVSSLPANPLPTQYWTRPINALNNNWYSIGGNWLGFGQLLFANTGQYNASGNYNPYTTAPSTSHILWTKPEAFGGTMGGEFGGSETGNYYSTRQYERMFSPIIIQGILYYTQYPGSTNNPSGWVAVDLKTGQTIWTDDNSNYGGGSPQQTALTSAGIVTALRCGQILDFVTPNQYGGLAYLWSTGNPSGINVAPGSTTYNMFDALTGKYVLSIVNGTSLTITEDQSGNLIGYYVNSTAGSEIINGVKQTNTGPTLNEWNSTQAIGVTGGSLFAEWRPVQDGVISFQLGIQYATPVPTNYTGNTLPGPLGITYVNSGDIVLTSLASAGSTLFQSGWQIEAGFDANTGAQLWITNRTETPFTRLYVQSGLVYTSGNGVFVEYNLDTFTATGYSFTSGQQLWTTVMPNPNAYDADLMNGMVANGVLYLAGLGGDAYAISVTNGTVLWHYNTGSAQYDTPYGVWPLWDQGLAGFSIAGGVMFIGEGHEYSPPLFRGASQLALNLTTGQPIWSILAFDADGGIAVVDGVMTTINAYDNQVYGYGQGPSKTTVNTPSAGATTAIPITITGSVTDISAGSQQEAVAANFPNGLPCVSDASMSQWMEYVYSQQPLPNNTTGVPVTLSVTDSNANTRTIGTATTDASGTFIFHWTPDITGNYTLTATFQGSGGYYGSYAETGFYVSASPTTAPTVSPLNEATTQNYVLGLGIATIIVIIIGIAVLAILMVRKRA